MKAAQITAFGGPEVMKTVDGVDKPTPGPGQVLVEVHAAGLNPFDGKMREGAMPKLQLPAILGGDLSGVVVELGEGVSGLEVGQEVYGSANAAGGQGSFAEFTVAKALRLAPKPTNIDFVQAGALPLAGASAYQAIVDLINLQPDQKILIHGGAGGIGNFAVQIAHDIGAHVTATASAKDIDFVKSLGADEAIDYQSQDFTQLVKDYDAVFDTVGGETNSKSYGVLKPGGTFVSMLVPPDEERVKAAGINYTAMQSEMSTERLTKVARLIDTGKIKVNIDKVFPLEQAAEALEYLKTGHPRGKVVLKIKD
ncbi:MAG TPA: NADP-dependent oxidoreductase [Candidatus Saccharimonadia bacterium]|nr:NADP-dependent oxidoreductase [Candidatus Saccharimonadia bacterium]